MSSLSRSRASLHFNPRTPRGVRPVPSPTGWASLKFQSTHPARGATPHVGQRPVQQAISIHAPREGCDAPPHGSKSARGHFNPRTPRGVRQKAAAPGGACRDDFNPRTPRGVRREGSNPSPAAKEISIHAPREGCDGTYNPKGPNHWLFQSTHPARGATASGLVTPK